VGTAEVDLSCFRDLVSRTEQTADPDTRLRLLRTAMRLSRGPLLDDLPSVERGGPPLGGIEAEVRAAGLALARSAIDAGDPGVALDWLENHAGREPLDEPVQAALLTALAASGRPAEALTRYERLRQQLAAALGVSPSEELQQACSAVLAQDRDVAAALPVATPAQLPGDVPGFAGRAGHLARLDTVLEAAAAQTPTAVVITAVSGTAGVGKTALAVRWAHSVAARFPDGQLYVNLRGFDAGGRVLDPAAAVRGFLDALGPRSRRVRVETPSR